MDRIIRLLIILSLSTVPIAYAGKDTNAPRVVETFPLNESNNVDPSINEISVTFNEQMLVGANMGWRGD